MHGRLLMRPLPPDGRVVTHISRRLQAKARKGLHHPYATCVYAQFAQGRRKQVRCLHDQYEPARLP